MNTDQKPVNFYFGNALKEEVLITNNKEYNYIILQNDFFHLKNAQLVDEMYSLKKEYEDLEDENESLEKSKTSLKGYIKNVGEYSALSKKLVNHYNLSLGSFEKKNNQILWNVKLYGATFLILEHSILWISSGYYGLFWIFLLDSVLGYFTIQLYKQYKDLVYIKDIHQNGTVIKLKQEMKLAEQGNDFLRDICIDLM